MAFAPTANSDSVVERQERQLLDIDSERFRACFDRAPFLIGPRLCEHPLFEIERLMQLARELPADKVEYNAGSVPIDCNPEETPRTGLSALETIRRIEQCSSWMVLKNAELTLEYRRLLEACLAEVAVHSEPVRPGMGMPEAFIFLSSPGTVTPYHMDPEHNFLLQIRGDKRMTLFDRSVVPSEALERFYSGAHRNMPFDERFMADSTTFDLPAGRGLHVPVTAPHYVVNGSGVSISFSITFRTPDLERTAEAYFMNSRLRRLGIKPANVGVWTPRDQLKSLTLRGWRKSLRIAGLGRDS